MFTEVRNALIAEFEDIGNAKTVMMDFESAAHNALEQVFPEWTIKTCYFHFVKNIRTQMEIKVSTTIRTQDDFKKWMNQIFGKFLKLHIINFYYLGSVFLPINDVRRVFEYLLNNLPHGLNNEHLFVKYLRRFWLPKLDKITCWNSDQPRTNNPAEAYHSKIQKAFE